METKKEPGKLYTISGLLKDSFFLIKKNIIPMLWFELIFVLLGAKTYLFLFLHSKTKEMFAPHNFFGHSFVNGFLSFPATIPATIISVAIMAIPSIALIFMLDKISDDKTITIGEVFNIACEKFIPYFWVYMLFGLSIQIGFILLYVPGIILFFWFLFSPVVVVLEDKRYFAALARSRQLVSGNIEYIFNTGLGCVLVYLIPIVILLGILWAILYFMAKLPITYIVSIIVSLWSVIGFVPLTLINVLMFKNLREIKGDRVVAVPWK